MVDGVGYYFWMDRLTDVLFIVDLVLNFFTGWVTKEGAVILDRRVIVQVRGVWLCCGCLMTQEDLLLSDLNSMAHGLQYVNPL
jgi:hypothetical protein